ncbi:MAG: hypothetical protein AAB446_02680 [Patescibacteria group bacterium]
MDENLTPITPPVLQEPKGNNLLIIVLLSTLILVIITVAGYFFLNKNSSVSSENIQSQNTSLPNVLKNIIPEYVFSITYPKTLTDVKLSHNSISLKSPWGLEKSFKGNADSLGQYVFTNGIKMTVTLNKINPQDELKQMNLSADEQKQYDSLFQFIDSKIGSNYSSYEYLKFLEETTQQTVDEATTQQDKDGYAKVLVIKNTLLIPSSQDTVYQFTNQNGKGFVYIKTNADIPSSLDFWNQNGWRYTFMFPANQNISKDDIDALIKSIKSL